MSDSMAEAVSTAIGWLIAAGSTLLYSPMIFRVLRKKSAEGLALSTWWLKFSAYSATLVYNIMRRFPLNTYIETAVTFCEAGLMLFLVLFYQESFCTPLNIAAMGLYAAAAVLLATTDRDTVDVVLPVFALYASTISTLAILPQIFLNFKRRSSGEFSPITALLACGGNGLRIFTTLVVTGDVVLLLGFVAGSVVNGVLLLQIYLFRPESVNNGVPVPVVTACKRFWMSDVFSKRVTTASKHSTIASVSNHLPKTKQLEPLIPVTEDQAVLQLPARSSSCENWQRQNINQ